MYTLFKYLLVGWMALSMLACQQPLSNREAADRPNIIIIYADDLGYGDLGVYGHPTIATPYLDQMAAEGLKFNQFYVGASVCTPSRAALLTGRLPIRSGMVSDRIRVLFPFSLEGLPPEEVTLAEALKEQGYATGIFGKWHLGHLPPYLPTQHGFDTYFGLPYSNDMRTTPGSGWSAARNYPPLPLIQDDSVLHWGVDQTQLTKQYTEKAIEFISANQDAPFFAYIPHSFPHIPLYASDDFLGKSARGLYGDVVEELDWSVGQILQTLRDLAIDKNTLVFFTSDNGPWLVMGERGGSAGLLREGKGCTWEGGMREPALAWWPGTIEAGRSTQQMATTMDLFATAVELAGGQLPTDRTMDGTSMVPIFEQDAAIRDEIYYYLGAQLFAVRKGPWKLHYKTLTPYVGQQADSHDPPLLFHMGHDPSELNNVAEDHPEVVEQLHTVAQQHLDAFEPPPSVLEVIDTALRQGTKAYTY